MDDGADAMAREAEVFSHYLLGIRPIPEITERYRRANEKLAIGSGLPADEALIDFALRHPRWLSLLDAAAGAVRPSNGLRRKLVVMTAILETHASCAARFEPLAAGMARLFTRCAFIGGAAVLKAALGLPLYLAVTWKR